MLSDHAQLEQLFMDQSKYVKIVLAFVIKESHIFYTHLEYMDELNTAKNQVIFNKLIAKTPQNEIHRRNCV
jgi:hypothetical protein